jgi:hypothetical protein
MKILDSAKKLIQEDLDVIGGEVLRRNDDLVQVGLHQFRDHVNLLEEIHVRRLKQNFIYFNAMINLVQVESALYDGMDGN